MGLLTDQPELAAKHLEALGYVVGEFIFDPEQGVTLAMCKSQYGSPQIEIITPDKSNQSLYRLLQRKGDYIYHLCFEIQSLENVIDTLKEYFGDGIVQIVKPKPALLFNNARVAFYAVAGIGIIELVESA